MKIGVLGAGAIGAHVGVRLAAAGLDVVLVGRQALLDAHAAGTLRAVSLAGTRVAAPAGLRCTSEVAELADVDACLVCVKSRDTAEAGRALAGVLRPDAWVVSLQNGLHNPAGLRAAGLPRVLAGMVSFNVFVVGGEYRQATSGPVMIERIAACPPVIEALQAAAQSCDLELELRDDMQAVQAGKLLLNLNNAICTIAGVSIADSLRSRDLRRCFAASLREALAVFGAAKLPIARIGRLPPRLIARVLTWPDAIVLRVAKSMIAIDPGARSSTLQDLERGRPTEIDALNGEIVAQAERAGVACPVNRWIVARVHAMEGRSPPEFLAPARLWAELASLAG